MVSSERSRRGTVEQFQLEIARMFFDLAAFVGFLLAGGGALIAQGIVERETDDLDFFATRADGNVAGDSDALTTAAEQRRWVVQVIRTGPEYRRLRIARPGIGGEGDEVFVDLAIDTPTTGAPTITIAGPSFLSPDRRTLLLGSVDDHYEPATTAGLLDLASGQQMELTPAIHIVEGDQC